MAHLYKCTTFTGGSGREYVGDVSDLKNNSNAWWIPCRILGIAPVDFVLLLKDTFHASHFSYSAETNVLSYSWDKKEDAVKYKNWINGMARKANAII